MVTKTYITKRNESIGCSGVKHQILEQRRRFLKVTNHASPSDNPMDESVFEGCQGNGTHLTALCQV